VPEVLTLRGLLALPALGDRTSQANSNRKPGGVFKQ